MGGSGKTDRTGADDGNGEDRTREDRYIRIHRTTSFSRTIRTQHFIEYRQYSIRE